MSAKTRSQKKNRVRRIALPKIKEQHLEGMFGDFREVVGSRIGELKATGNPQNLETARFFEYLLEQVDAEQYFAIQQRYLKAEIVDRDSDMAKYLDPVVWFESKVRIARRIALDKKPPLRILDLGTGPGHFPVVARFYGHDVTGTDLPKRSQGVDATGHLYDALCDAYGVKRVSHMIRPLEPLGDLGGRYDLVTAFLAAFNVDEHKQPWTADHWRFFLASLRRDVLAEHGTLFMTLANHKLTDNSWDYLRKRAVWSDDQSKQILIADFDRAD